jgi:hypothetical protein
MFERLLTLGITLQSYNHEAEEMMLWWPATMVVICGIRRFFHISKVGLLFLGLSRVGAPGTLFNHRNKPPNALPRL